MLVNRPKVGMECTIFELFAASYLIKAHQIGV